LEDGVFLEEQVLQQSQAIIFNLDPVAFSVFGVEIRYYGIVFSLTLIIAFLFWNWQMKRGGYKKEMIDSFLFYGIIGTVVGARLGHCLFYSWDYYSKHLLEILRFWEGGLASHGATIGLLTALYIYSRVHKMSYFETVDRFSFSAAIGASGVRLGNFLNSEIVGRTTDLPWAVRFMRYDNGEFARHPSQLYEFAMGIVILLALLIIDKIFAGEKRPCGLLTGVFLSLYFIGRFLVEFFKEYQTGLAQGAGLTMGQYLSIIPFVFGATVLIWSLKTGRHYQDNKDLDK